MGGACVITWPGLCWLAAHTNVPVLLSSGSPVISPGVFAERPPVFGSFLCGSENSPVDEKEEMEAQFVLWGVGVAPACCSLLSRVPAPLLRAPVAATPGSSTDFLHGSTRRSSTGVCSVLEHQMNSWISLSFKSEIDFFFYFLSDPPRRRRRNVLQHGTRAPVLLLLVWVCAGCFISPRSSRLVPTQWKRRQLGLWPGEVRRLSRWDVDLPENPVSEFRGHHNIFRCLFYMATTTRWDGLLDGHYNRSTLVMCACVCFKLITEWNNPVTLNKRLWMFMHFMLKRFSFGLRVKIISDV